MAPPSPALLHRSISSLDATPSRDQPATRIPDLLARQATVTLATSPNQQSSGTNSSDAGAIVGIVLGSVVGFLLLSWLFYKFLHQPNKDDWDHGAHPGHRRRSYSDSDLHEHHHHHHHHCRHRDHRERPDRSHHAHSRSHSRPAVVQVQTTTTTRPAAVYDYEKRRPGRA